MSTNNLEETIKLHNTSNNSCGFFAFNPKKCKDSPHNRAFFETSFFN